MLLGAGRLGDWLGDPLRTISNDRIFWTDVNKTTMRALWQYAFGLPASAMLVTYDDGVVQQRALPGTPGAVNPNFPAATAGVIPLLAAVLVPAVAGSVGLGSNDAYDPLGSRKLANLLTFRNKYSHRARGQYRIADASLARYELFWGVDVMPDFTQPAWQTFTALPFTTPALTVGHTHYLVCRRRNVHNLLSQNVIPTIIVIAADGTQTLGPSAPSSQSITPAAAGAGKVAAKYDYALDAANAIADTWVVWLTSNGVDPNPAVDVPAYTTAMIFADGVASLSWTSGTFANGTTLKAIVRARRTGPPQVDSTNSAIMSTTSVAVGPVVPANAQAFLGQSARQV